MGKYYLYRHIRLDKNIPFYIGFGTKPSMCNNYYDEYKRAFSKQRNGFWKIIASKSDYSVEIIYEDDDKEIVLRKEIEFIKLYGRINIWTGTLVNLSAGGIYRHEWSCASRKKASASKKGVKHTRDSVEKRAAKLRNRPFSEERRANMVLNHFTKRDGYVSPLKGKKKTPEEAERLRTANIGKRLSIRTEFKSRPILKLDAAGNKIAAYSGAAEAAKEMKCSVGLITHAVRGRIKTARGFRWKYLVEVQKSL